MSPDDDEHRHDGYHHVHGHRPDADGTAGNSGGLVGSKRRHVILMIGDGMPTASEVAASRYLHGVDFGLSFHAFPYRAYKTTWDVDVYNGRAAELGVDAYSPDHFVPTVGYDPARGGPSPYPLTPDSEEIRSYFASSSWIHPDSASTATAMSTGVKTRSAELAWRPDAGDDGALETSAEFLRRTYGMAVGFVTTVPFSHATPAGFFSHNPDRGNTTAIANEILNVVRPEVVIGGGWQDSGYYEPIDLQRAVASDDWVFAHLESDRDSNDAILAASVRANQENRRLLGIYGGGDRPSYLAPVPADDPGNPSIDASQLDRPSLSASSVAALEVLSRDPDGFFLIIEQGHIDWANHRQEYTSMIGGVWELDQAVRAVSAFVDRPDDDVDWSNTTVVVTADHANGYMRFSGVLGAGALPREIIETNADGAESISYPNGEVVYFSQGNHTSELVSIYAKGFAAEKLAFYAKVDEGCQIMDDTAIYRLTLDAARR